MIDTYSYYSVGSQRRARGPWRSERPRSRLWETVVIGSAVLVSLAVVVGVGALLLTALAHAAPTGGGG